MHSSCWPLGIAKATLSAILLNALLEGHNSKNLSVPHHQNQLEDLDHLFCPSCQPASASLFSIPPEEMCFSKASHHSSSRACYTGGRSDKDLHHSALYPVKHIGWWCELRKTRLKIPWQISIIGISDEEQMCWLFIGLFSLPFKLSAFITSNICNTTKAKIITTAVSHVAVFFFFFYSNP